MLLRFFTTTSTVVEQGSEWLTLNAAGPNAVAALLVKITQGIAPIATPIGALGATIFLLLLLGAPILPEAAQANKGYFMRMCLIVAVIAFIPQIVGWLAGLGR